MGHPRIRRVTKEEEATYPKDIIVELEKPFVDERGAIYPLLDVPMESCVLITSKKGTQRANHYHQTDWHYCYVLEGKIEYYEKPHGSSAAPKTVIINKGQMFFTGPNLDHTMYFLEDTSFLTFGRNPRAQEVYEADVIRVPSLKTE